MRQTTKLTILLVVLAVAVATLASQFVTVPQRTSRQPGYTSNAGELTRDVLVGQTFESQRNNLSGVSVMFATYSGRTNTEPVRFHLRSSITSREDIRSADVTPDQLGDNQFHTFSFEPIPDSAGQTYFFFVVSPQSLPGNAVTVDIDTRDPYHRGSAFIVRDKGPAVTDPVIVSAAGKPTADLAFEAYHHVPLRTAVLDRTQAVAAATASAVQSNPGLYGIWLQAFLSAALFMLVVLFARSRFYEKTEQRWGKRGLTLFALLGLAVAAWILRMRYAQELPLTYDEGNYLYDAWAARHGILAGGDGYVKAPLVILWIALWQVIGGDTIVAGRLASVLAGTLTIFPLFWLARELWGRKVGLITAAGWAFFGAAQVFSIYIHTQPVALLFAVSGLAVLLLALRGNTPHVTFLPRRSSGAAGIAWFVLAGVLLGLGVASRKSVLAVGLVPLLFVLLESRSWKLRVRHLLAVGIGFLIIMALFLGTAAALYGTQGILEAVGVNSGEDGLTTGLEPHEIEQARAYSLRGMTPFFRESWPLFWLAAIGLGAAGERALRALTSRTPGYPHGLWLGLLDHVLPKLGWLGALVAYWWGWQFFVEYEGEAFMIYGLPTLWWLGAAVLVLLTLLPRPLREKLTFTRPPETAVPVSTQPAVGVTLAASLNQPQELPVAQRLSAWLVIPVWMGGLMFFYMNWIKFHANYISEFIPPLIVLAGFGAWYLVDRLRGGLFLASDYPVIELLRRLLLIGAVVMVVWGMTATNFITFFYEHTGTFSLGSLRTAAVWAKQNIPPDQTIFTGAAAVPYLSGHRVALDIAHPRWYAYEFTRKDTARLNTFLPPAEEMVQAFRDAQWVLLEGQTGFSFLMEYSEIEAGLERDFVQVQGIENGSNTMTFYRRVR